MDGGIRPSLGHDPAAFGWCITPTGTYKISLPALSSEEQSLISAVDDAFRERTRHQSVKDREESLVLIKKLIEDYAHVNRIYIDSGQAEYLGRVASMHIYGFCFIDELLVDPAIEEISIIGINKPAYVYVRNAGWQEVNARFTSEAAIADVVNKMAHSIGRRITLQNPRLDAMLPNGDRLHASLPPVSAGEITIRRFRETPFSPYQLCENKTISPEALAYLSLILQSDSSLLLAGNTASGKTSMLNALFSFVPLTERVLITEETPEINILHPHTVRLVANRDMGISLEDLVYDSFRMRPDRMIVGEIRNREEARALFEVLLAGQARGSYATMHAQSVDEAQKRLTSFGIDPGDMASIDCMVVQKRLTRYDRKRKLNYEIRRVVEIAQNTGGAFRPVFQHDHSQDALKATGSMLLEGLGERLGLGTRETEEEFRLRVKAVQKNAASYAAYFSYVQKQFYGLSYESP